MYGLDVCYFVIVDNKVSDNIIFDNCNCFATNGDLGFYTVFDVNIVWFCYTNLSFDSFIRCYDNIKTNEIESLWKFSIFYCCNLLKILYILYFNTIKRNNG